MNRPIIRLYGLVVVLFALLVAFTSRWTIFEASSLRENRLNVRALLEQERIDRGPIVAADGTVLARSVRGRRRHLPAHLSDGHAVRAPIGYSSVTGLGSTGLERYRNKQLNGKQEETNLQAILDQLQGKKPQGDKVVTTLDPQRPARRQRRPGRTPRRGRRTRTAQRRGHRDGLLAELRPQRAALAAPMPNARTRQRSAADQPRHRSSATRPARPSRSSPPPPRSTPARSRPNRRVSGRNDILVSGVPLQNDDDESFGQITLTASAREIRQHGLGAGGRTPRQAHARAATWSASASTASPSSTTPPKRCPPAASTLGGRACSRPPARWSTSGAWGSARTNSR